LEVDNLKTKKNPLCNCKVGQSILASDINHRISSENFDYFKCSSCNLIRLQAIPPDLAQYYPNSYYQFPSLDKLKRIGVSDPFKLRILKKYINSGSLLEIGPAFGVFAYQALQNGFNVHVIEMDSDCCVYLRDVVGLTVFKSDSPEKVILELDSFDVIALWHVIEHLADPWSLLSSISKNLRHDGLLMLSAPNPNSWQFKVMGKLWPHLDAPRHLYLIPLPVLIEYCKSLGLSCIHSTTIDSDSRKWDSFGWERFFMNFFKGSVSRVLAQIFGMALAVILRPISLLMGCGSAYTVIFIKDDEAT